MTNLEPVDRPQDIRLAAQQPPAENHAKIRFEIVRAGSVSLGIFDPGSGRLVRTLLRGEAHEAGTHTITWDGRDNRGVPVEARDYQWRLVATPGLTARYVTTLGINPPGGEDPVPAKSWVGDHLGAGIVDVDDSGVYIGSPLTEGMMMMLKANTALTDVVWTRAQFYQGGQLRRAATSGRHLYLLHPNGKLRRLDRETGAVQAEWQVDWDGTVPSDLDACGDNLVVTYPEKDAVRWLDGGNGVAQAEVQLQGAGCVAAVAGRQSGEALAGTGGDLYRLEPGQPPRQVASLDGQIGAMDYDAQRKELWVVLDEHRVVRLDADFVVAQAYSPQPRESGPYDPTRLAGVYDVAADLQGGFFIGEPHRAPRRIAHFARDGSLIGQSFGGMSFYVDGTFDPEDPARLIGIAPEGWVNVYRIDYEAGTWDVEACYQTGRLGDGLYPHAAAFRAVRKNGQLYLYHRVVPAVLRIDAGLRRAVPVAIAGRVINQGRTFFQFAGSGRDGYPKPWVAAAERQGYSDLSQAPSLYSWADTDGDGQFDPDEFRFYPDAERGISFHNPGDFARNGDYLGSANTNEPHAIVRLPVVGWEGPEGAAPRWDWSRLETAGRIVADSYGYGSPRGLSVGPDDSVSVAYQAGIMIREHGQYEGGDWPECAARGSRVLGFDRELQPLFAVGRQSKNAAEANTGVLYYPMRTTPGPNGSIVVNDQTKQPAQVWTGDGLYVGGFLDRRTDDGLADDFYRVHGDDNQGATLVTTAAGKTYWLMPYVGHNRLYEITGWEAWQRRSGVVARPARLADCVQSGTGLAARYYQDDRPVLETTEATVYFEPFGPERHAEKISAPYRAVWTGFLEPPLSDRYGFRSLLGANEQVVVWIDGQVVHAAGLPKRIDREVNLVGGRRHRVRIEYLNPDGRAELKLLWFSRVMDPTRLPREALHPE